LARLDHHGTLIDHPEDPGPLNVDRIPGKLADGFSERERVEPVRSGSRREPPTGCPRTHADREGVRAARAKTRRADNAQLQRLTASSVWIAIACVVTCSKSGPVVVFICVTRTVGPVEALVGFAIVAMRDGVIPAAILPIVLRVPEAVGIAARERGFLIATSECRRLAEPAESTTASLRVSRDDRRRHECESENEKGNESNHDLDLEQA
jgi:hypothetical protein